MRSLQENQTRKRFKVSVGIAGKRVINRTIAGQGDSNRTKDNQILLERETMRKARKANPIMLEHLFGISRLT